MPVIPMFDPALCDPIRLADVAAEDLAAVVAAHVGDHRFAIGGYGEVRRIYAASDELGRPSYPPALHLGIDVWGRAGDSICAPFAGTVTFRADHAGPGDFGPTLILDGDDGLRLLIAHLSRASLGVTAEGERVAAGEPIGAMGSPDENGGWPPHTHVQVVTANDSPGVVPIGTAGEGWLRRCPDPTRWIVG